MGRGRGGEPPQEDGRDGGDGGAVHGDAGGVPEGLAGPETPQHGRQGGQDAQGDGKMHDDGVEPTQPGDEPRGCGSWSMIVAAGNMVVTTVPGG
jgi:hypothetical protein